MKWKKLRTEQALPALGSFPLYLAGQANVDTGGTPYKGLLVQLAPSLSPVVSDARVRERERAHREDSSVLVPLGYVASDGGQACPLCHLGPPNPAGSLGLTGCVSVPTGHWVPWLIAPLCLKTLPPSQPSRLRDEGGKWPDSGYPRPEWHQLNLQRLGEVPGLEARCQGLGHLSVSVHVSCPHPLAARTF